MRMKIGVPLSVNIQCNYYAPILSNVTAAFERIKSVSLLIIAF